MTPAYIRAFFACSLSRQNLASVVKLQDTLKIDTLGWISWTRPENIHITLKFIGEFNTDHLEPLRGNLTHGLADFQAFQIEIAHVGAFPSTTQARVIWVGTQHTDSLLQLAVATECACETIGYPRENRPFTGHLTLGRVRPYARATELRDLQTALEYHSSTAIGKQEIDSITFWKSQLTQNGPRYTALFDIPLAPR